MYILRACILIIYSRCCAFNCIPRIGGLMTDVRPNLAIATVLVVTDNRFPIYVAIKVQRPRLKTAAISGIQHSGTLHGPALHNQT